MKMFIEIDYGGVIRTRATGVTGDDPIRAAQLFKLIQPQVDKIDEVVKSSSTKETDTFVRFRTKV
jgi:hypothetical protein